MNDTEKPKRTKFIEEVSDAAAEKVLGKVEGWFQDLKDLVHSEPPEVVIPPAPTAEPTLSPDSEESTPPTPETAILPAPPNPEQHRRRAGILW